MCTSTCIPPAAYGDYFWCCDKLKKLDVSHNRIRALPDCFSDLKRLGTLSASHNYLKELPQSCSWGCINLVSRGKGVWFVGVVNMSAWNRTSVLFCWIFVGPK